LTKRSYWIFSNYRDCRKRRGKDLGWEALILWRALSKRSLLCSSGSEEVKEEVGEVVGEVVEEVVEEVVGEVEVEAKETGVTKEVVVKEWRSRDRVRGRRMS